MTSKEVEAFKQRVAVFDDSHEVADMLWGIESYETHEAAVHIEGLWDLTKQLMKYIEDNHHEQT